MSVQPQTRLDDSALAVLGLIALRGPSTAYELKRALSRITSEFWSVPHVTPYRATKGLARAGMLTAEQERGGRRRRVYSLTDEGRSALGAWLSEPSSETMTIRDPGQLRLLFAELTDPAATAELARAQISVYEARLATLDATEARLAGDVVRASRLGPLQLGRAVYSAALAFWESVAEAPDSPACWTPAASDAAAAKAQLEADDDPLRGDATGREVAPR
jgi:PadR family transcriptional regulator, regulatory protein AphA